MPSRPKLDYDAPLPANEAPRTALHRVDRAICGGMGLVGCLLGLLALYWTFIGSKNSKDLDGGSAWFGIGLVAGGLFWCWIGLRK